MRALSSDNCSGLSEKKKVQRPRLGDGLYDPDAMNGLLHRERA
jgi:hypothetical protein